LVGKGTAQLDFRIHKTVITYYSPEFFGRAFNSGMIEGQTQSMTLEDIEPHNFGIFNNWLYTQKVENEDGNRLKLIELAKFWSLAQRFIIFDLAERLLKDMEANFASSDPLTGSTLKDFQHYAYLVAEDQEDSPLRKLAIKKTLSEINMYNIDKIIGDFPEGMLVDFTKALAEGCTKLLAWSRGLGFGGFSNGFHG
jgi:hypothetical protein